MFIGSHSMGMAWIGMPSYLHVYGLLLFVRRFLQMSQFILHLSKVLHDGILNGEYAIPVLHSQLQNMNLHQIYKYLN